MGKIIAKLSTWLATDKKGRKAVIIAIAAPFVAIIGLFAIFFFIISAILGMIGAALQDTVISQSWTDVNKYVADAVSGINVIINGEIKENTYKFMPDFSINISKAVLQQTLAEADNAPLLLYDSAELNRAEELQNDFIARLRQVKNQAELDKLTKGTSASGVKLSELKKDGNFIAGETDDISKFSDETQQLIRALVQSKMPDYKYSCTENITDGKAVRTQTLTVTQDGKIQTVRYTVSGEGDIYLPRFLAMYHAQNGVYVTELLGAGIKDMTSDIAEAAKAGELNSENDLKTALKLAKLDLFGAAKIGKVVQNAVKDGKISVKYSITEKNNTQSLDIRLTMPTEEEWYQLFDIAEENKPLVKDNEDFIIKMLQAAGIDDFNFKIDGVMQTALFRYFEGFFNLPVDSHYLDNNGILSSLGDIQPFHRHGTNAVSTAYEQGVTLGLTSPDAPVIIDLLPQAEDVIQDAVIYDVYNANNRKPVKDKPSYTYNCCAVEIAYIIDTDEFKSVYGFDFPDIVMTDGELLKADGTLTLLVEYSCMDVLKNIDEQDIGRSLFDIFDDEEKWIIGYSHSGQHSKDKDENTSNVTWYHVFGSEPVCHLGIKTAFIDGEVTPPEYQQPHIYNGLSAKFVGAKVNPLLWFKAYRTDINEDILDSL